MSLNTYITTQPIINNNPYLIMQKIRGDLYQDAPAVILMKRQEFANLKIAEGELAEDFAIRVHTLAFEIPTLVLLLMLIWSSSLILESARLRFINRFSLEVLRLSQCNRMSKKQPNGIPTIAE